MEHIRISKRPVHRKQPTDTSQTKNQEEIQTHLDVSQIPTTPEQVQQLQRQMGNQYVLRLLERREHIDTPPPVFMRQFGVQTSSPQAQIQRNPEDEPVELVMPEDDEMPQSLGSAPSNAAPDPWAVNSDTWNTLDKGKQAQFDADAAIMYQTMFAKAGDSGDASWFMSAKEAKQHKQKQEFMKRMFLAQAMGGVKYSKTDNPTEADLKDDLNMPMASLIAHGQRHIFDTKNMTKRKDEKGNDISSVKDFARFLASGNEDALLADSPLNTRGFASHGITRDKSGKIVEHKEGLLGQMATDTMGHGKHYGMNLPLGGIGNKNASGDIIGESGHSIVRDKKGTITKDTSRQHGHAYVNINKAAEAMMIGIESNAPGSTDMFGHGHGIMNAFINQKEKKSVTGGQKMSKLMGENAPAEYGGKQTAMDDQKFSDLKEVYGVLSGRSEEEQQAFFKQFLKMNPKEASAFVRKFLEESRKKPEENSAPTSQPTPPPLTPEQMAELL